MTIQNTSSKIVPAVRAVVDGRDDLSARTSELMQFLAINREPDDGEYVDGLTIVARDGAEITVDVTGPTAHISGQDAGTNFLQPQPVTFQPTRDAHAQTDGPLTDTAFVTLVGGLGTQRVSADRQWQEAITGLHILQWVRRWIPAWADHHQDGDR